MNYAIYDIHCRMVAEIPCFQKDPDERHEFAESTGRRLLGDKFLCAELIGGER